ncbi:MAG: SH3 domain-containing protein [Clostridia bacterium]|nr:SH3 domain-containing protein [Clostridia bacterium]
MKLRLRILALAIGIAMGLMGVSALAEGKIVTTGSVHMRTGPGLDYSSRRTIDEGVTRSWDYTDTDDRGVTWYHVSYGGKKGWVSSMYARAKKSGGSSGSSDKVTTSGSVNLRRGPGLDYDSITTIEAGTTLSWDRTEKDERGVAWYHVSYGGKKGWVSSKYVGKGSGGASQDNRVTTTGSVNLRYGPGLDYADIRAIGEGVTLTWDRTERDERGVLWYRVRYNGDRGWISSRYAKKGSSSSSARRLTTTGNVRLRRGPGLDYTDIMVIEADTVLTWDDRQEDDRGVTWYHVSYSGKKGWVSGMYARIR